jgi:D-alanyl-D-alanine carboxypeptidase (penicillin-binding protein 5/6)
VITVIFGASSPEERFDETVYLSNYALKFYDNYTIQLKSDDNTLAMIPTVLKNYDFLNIELESNFIKTLPKGLEKEVEIRSQIPEFIDFEVNKGDTVGYIEFLIGDKVFEKINILASHDLKNSDGLKYWVDYFVINYWN